VVTSRLAARSRTAQQDRRAKHLAVLVQRRLEQREDLLERERLVLDHDPELLDHLLDRALHHLHLPRRGAGQVLGPALQLVLEHLAHAAVVGDRDRQDDGAHAEQDQERDARRDAEAQEQSLHRRKSS
jgi:hypothetical protein